MHAAAAALAIIVVAITGFRAGTRHCDRKEPVTMGSVRLVKLSKTVTAIRRIDERPHGDAKANHC
jgi:hypothetical protein